MEDLNKKTEWKDFSLFKEDENNFKVMKVYRKIVIVDLKGKRFEFEGNFCVSRQENQIVATALS